MKICCGIFILSAIGFLAYYLIETKTQDNTRLNTDHDEFYQNATFLENHPEKRGEIRAIVIDGSGDFDMTDDEELNFNQFENMPGKPLNFAFYTARFDILSHKSRANFWVTQGP